MTEWAESDLWTGADVQEYVDPKMHTWEVRGPLIIGQRWT